MTDSVKSVEVGKVAATQMSLNGTPINVAQEVDTLLVECHPTEADLEALEHVCLRSTTQFDSLCLDSQGCMSSTDYGLDHNLFTRTQ